MAKHISFTNIVIGVQYSRPELAEVWGYETYHALARGVVTPREDNKIILFVTEEKQVSATAYEDSLAGDRLYWEGPNDHFAEERMLKANEKDEEIHLFHRSKHHADFIYLGRLRVVNCERFSNRPSCFTFELLDA